MASDAREHPAEHELVRLRETLPDEARASRLCAEKFELDGLHAGTGGDHVVLAGCTPADSPFLRRPWLPGGMTAYFNNHPALSYLFAGRFIGPTSQAPRIDEARHESLYELEIALQQLAAAAAPLPREPGQPQRPGSATGDPAASCVLPWLTDRVFRNILTDLTGHTPGPFAPPPEERNPDYACTLDPRRIRAGGGP